MGGLKVGDVERGAYFFVAVFLPRRRVVVELGERVRGDASAPVRERSGACSTEGAKEYFAGRGRRGIQVSLGSLQSSRGSELLTAAPVGNL